MPHAPSRKTGRKIIGVIPPIAITGSLTLLVILCKLFNPRGASPIFGLFKKYGHKLKSLPLVLPSPTLPPHYVQNNLYVVKENTF